MLQDKKTDTKKTGILVACFWSLVLFLSLYAYIHLEYQGAEKQATLVARANLDRDRAVRQWVSDRGGVYAKINELTQPSPYLAHIPTRDIHTPVGDLTLLNPAYMLRLMMDEHELLYGIKGRIVGLKALRPENIADDWERNAISQFEADKELKDYTEFDVINGESYMRMMIPLYMTQDCMKCHAVLGYQVGDLRGGVNVSVPLAKYYAAAKAESIYMAIAHGGIWLLGLFGIGFVTKRSVKIEEIRSRDVQELKETEKALREGDKHFRALFDQSSFGVAKIDSVTGKFIKVNKRYCDLVGYSMNEMLEINFQEITVAEDLQSDLKNMDRLRASEISTFQMEKRYRCRDGSIIWVKLTVLPLWSKDKEPDFHLAIIEDITERKRDEVELQKYRYQLEGLVQERTVELQKSLAEKEVLLKEVHHRVKNNMAMVSAFIQLQMNGADDVYSLGALGACENRIQAMSMVHKRLYQSDDFTSIDMKILFDEISGALFKKSDFDNIELDIQANDISLEMDAAIPCAMIINELLSNSLKYAFKDGQPGKISICMDVIKGGMYCLCVSDTGVGLSEDVFMGEADTLGLQLVNVFVDQLSGELEVHRKDGVTFKVVFPAGKTTNA